MVTGMGCGNLMLLSTQTTAIKDYTSTIKKIADIRREKK